MAGRVNRISRFNVTSLALGLAFLYLPIVILVIYSYVEWSRDPARSTV